MAKEELKYALSKGELHYIPNPLERRLQGKKECTYKIEKVLGQGGYGITYLASTKIEQGHTEHKIFYAIKEFFPKRDCSRDEGSSYMKLPEADMAKNDVMTWLDEFEQEAKQLNKICNKIPHVVKVNEVFRENNTAYYVMEYLNGGSLKDTIAETGLPERKALEILIPVARTVALLHEHRIIHCDIKDENIMMNKRDDGSLDPVLIDFGESRHLNADGSLTSKRVFGGGTPGYAPEEQLAGIITDQVDVYALAATLFKMLTGTPPQVYSSMTEEYIDKKLPGNISEQTRKAIKHALKQRREDRTGSVKQFVEELEGFIPNELSDGFVVAHRTEKYQIISVEETSSYYIRYKVNVTRSVQDNHDGLTQIRVIVGDMYEFFDINNHKRNNDKSLLTTGDISSSEQHFLDICKKITKGEICGRFYEGSSLGWVTFASNNTLYIVDKHYRRPLPWKRILTYGGICIGSILFVYGAINIYDKFEDTRTKERLEMSKRLSDAIALNDANVLKEFAEIHDSTRAYLPYALICYNNGDLDAAERFANNSLRAIIKQKRDSIAHAAQLNAQEQNIDEHSVNEEDNTRHARYQELLSTARQNLNKNLSVAELAIQNIISLNKSYADSAEVRKLQNQIAAIKREQERKKELAKLKERQEQAYIEGVSLYNAWSRHKRLGDESEEMIEKRRQAALKRLNDAEMSKVQKMLDNLKSNK